MLRLNLKTEPFWMPSDDPNGKDGPIMRLFNVRLQVRPLDAALFSTASAHAQAEVRKLAESMRKIRDAGGTVQGLADIDDDNVRAGLAHTYTIRSLFKYGVLAWTGVGEANAKEGDAPAPLDDENIKKFLDVPGIANEFFNLYQGQYSDLAVAKNGSSPVLNGTTAAGENIVPPVNRRMRRATAARKRKAADTAPTSNTH